MKYGRIKRQHGRIQGLDEILKHISVDCPDVARIVPGRISVRKGTTLQFKIQYSTPTGLKCLYLAAGTVQEVFLVCSDCDAVARWLLESGLVQ